MDIQRRRGDTCADEFTLTLDGSAVDLTGCTFVLTVDRRAAPNDTSTNLYQVEGVVSDPYSGIITFSPTSQQVDRVGFFYYDVEMTDAAGKKRTITPVGAKYVFYQDITK